MSVISGAGVFYFTDSTVGMPIITVGVSGLSSDNQTETISSSAATHIAITSGAQTVTAGVTSASVNFEIQDQFNNRVTTASGNATLSSSSTSMQFSPDGVTFGGISVGYSNGAGSFFFQDTTAGSATLVVSETGLTSGSQVETITPALETQVVITSAAQTVTAGLVSSAMTFEVRDQFDNRVTAFSGTANLSSPSSTMMFDTSSGGLFDGTVTSVTVSSGTGTLFFQETVSGNPDITVSVTGLTSATQTEAVMPAAAMKLVYISTPQSVVAGVASGLVSVEVQDVPGKQN